MTGRIGLAGWALIAVACGGGGAAASSSTSSTTPAASGETPSSVGADCTQEIAMVCGADQQDGCLLAHPSGTGQLTTRHVCVPTLEASGAQPCMQEIARSCPDGQIDACLVDPPVADQHICVVAR
jgi:hypothetical protein